MISGDEKDRFDRVQKENRLDLRKSIRVLIGALILFLLIIAAFGFRQENSRFVYAEHLDDVILSVADDEVTLREFGFYIYAVESFTQQQARRYNYKDPLDYWNTHFSSGMDSGFVSDIARDTAVNTCLGDLVYAKMADEAGFVMPSETSGPEDEDPGFQNDGAGDTGPVEDIEAKTDDWMSKISDEQVSRLGINRELVKKCIERSEKAKAYAYEYAKDADLTGYKGNVADLLSGGGKFFNEHLLSEYDYVKNEKLISELKFGRITVNYD